MRPDAETAAFALIEHKDHTNMKPKNTICLWFDKDAHEAVRFYAVTFPDSKVTAVHEAPGDYPGGKKGDVLTVEFTVLGIPCLGLNGGPAFRHTEAFSFQISRESSLGPRGFRKHPFHFLGVPLARGLDFPEFLGDKRPSGQSGVNSRNSGGQP